LRETKASSLSVKENPPCGGEVSPLSGGRVSFPSEERNLLLLLLGGEKKGTGLLLSLEEVSSFFSPLEKKRTDSSLIRGERPSSLFFLRKGKERHLSREQKEKVSFPLVEEREDHLLLAEREKVGAFPFLKGGKRKKGPLLGRESSLFRGALPFPSERKKRFSSSLREKRKALVFSLRGGEVLSSFSEKKKRKDLSSLGRRKIFLLLLSGKKEECLPFKRGEVTLFS